MGFIPKNTEIISLSKVREINPLVLAYIGDGVHSLYCRTKYVSTTTYKTNKLSLLVNSEVNAKSQAKKMEEILEKLTEEEKDVFLRARNAHVNTIAKNGTRGEYQLATGFEAIIGYLYLTGQEERIEQLLN